MTFLDPIKILVLREPKAADLPLPAYATPGSAGMDLHAHIEEPLTLVPGMRMHVSTGIRLALPPGYEAQVRARSGLALRTGVGLVNSPGTIDSDYRGTVGVLLINWGEAPVIIRRGDRIAQLVIAPVSRVEWQEVEPEHLPGTERQDGGFGHTGVRHDAGA